MLLCPFSLKSYVTLQGTNISQPGKRKIILNSAIVRGYVSSLEGTILWDVQPKEPFFGYCLILSNIITTFPAGNGHPMVVKSKGIPPQNDRIYNQLPRLRMN